MSTDQYIKLKEATEAGRILWHYTTWEGFESIVSNDELWASDWRYMNDKTELKHALEFCSGKYGEEMGHIEYLIRRLQTDIDLPLAAFVLSTSTAFDLLEQWRGYGSSSIGVALAFDDERLTSILAEQGMIRETCLYDGDQKIQRIASLSRSSIERQQFQQAIIDDPAKDDRDKHQAEKAVGYGGGADMSDFMRQQALTFKDPRFQAEKEVRFISDFSDAGSLLGGITWPHALENTPPKRAYRRRGSAVMPFLKLKLSVDIWVRGENDAVIQKPIKHPLVGVLFGPNSEPDILRQEISRANIAEWVASFGQKSRVAAHEIVVAVSDVPLRA